MLSGRMLKILEYLDKHQNTSYKEIAEDLKIKERYVRYDIDKINDYLYLCHFPLIERQSKGKILFPNIDISLLKNEEHFFYSANERLSLILLILLYDASHLKLNKLSEDLQVSRSTIKKDMSDLEKELYKKQLTIEYTDHFELHSDSKSIMSLRVYELSKYIPLLRDKNMPKNSFQAYVYHLIISYFDNVPLKELFQWIDKILEDNNEMNDEGYQFFAANIILLAYYILGNKALPPTIGFDAPRTFEKYNEEILAFEDIIQQEITHYYRGTLIRLLEYLDSKDGLYDYLNPTKIETIMNDLVNRMSELLNVDFSQDGILLESLAHHLPPLLKRIHTKRYMYHDLKVVIPEQDLYIYETLKRALKDIDILKDLKNQDEKVYLAVHFIVSMNRLKESSYKHIIIVCNYGYGTSAMLKETLTSEFQVKVIDILPHYKLSSFGEFEDVDYIVSTLSLKNTFGKVNIVVNPLLTSQDYAKLEEAGLVRKKVNVNYHALANKLYFLEKSERQKVLHIIQNELGYTETKLVKPIYKVSDLLRMECIQVINQKMDWRKSIYDSAELLENQGIVTPEYGEKIVTEIERIGFYCVTDGLFALFHGRNDDYVYRSGMSLIVNKQDMIFDDKIVKVVFCLASKDKKDQIPAMILLMRMIKNTDFLLRIESAVTSSEVLTILKECERKVL